MRLPKRYGQSRMEECPFCKEKALAVNQQGIPTCNDHKSEYVEVQCICGEHLSPLQGKFGTFFNCPNCGNVSLKKALEIKKMRD